MAATTSASSVRQGQVQQVPNSVGTAPPRLNAPDHACDCHHHIYDPARFPMPPNPNPRRPAPSNGTVSDYRLLQKRIGTTRSVVVQPHPGAESGSALRFREGGLTYYLGRRI